MVSFLKNQEAPKAYNDASLLGAMEHAGRQIEDASLRAAMKAEAGTPATRANIIATLLRRGYITRAQEQLYLRLLAKPWLVLLTTLPYLSPYSLQNGSNDSKIFQRVKHPHNPLYNDSYLGIPIGDPTSTRPQGNRPK